MSVCQHSDCQREHQNASYCCRLHQRLDALDLSIPEGAAACSSCGDAWAASDGLCKDCGPENNNTGPSMSRLRTHQLEDGGRLHEAHTARAMSDEELVEFFEVDREEWEVITANRWYNGSVWCHQLKCRPRNEVLLTQDIVQDALDELRDASTGPYIASHDEPLDTDRHLMVEPMLTDLHANMYAYAPETRGAHWDTEISTRLGVQGAKEVVAKAERFPGEIEQFLFPIGNDLVHVDQWAGGGSGGATSSGTVVDVDTRRRRTYRMIRKALETIVMSFRETAPVRMIGIGGNHAEFTEFTLTEVMDARFYNDPHVEVVNPDSDRWYERYGRVLLGFAHGDKVAKSRLPMLMPMEADGEDWAKSDHAELHMGHTHHLDQRGFAAEVEEDMTIRMRRCPTIVPRDAWSAGRGFTHVRAMEGYIWSREYGFEGLVNTTPQSIEDFADE